MTCEDSPTGVFNIFILLILHHKQQLLSTCDKILNLQHHTFLVIFIRYSFDRRTNYTSLINTLVKHAGTVPAKIFHKLMKYTNFDSAPEQWGFFIVSTPSTTRVPFYGPIMTYHIYKRSSFEKKKKNSVERHPWLAKMLKDLWLLLLNIERLYFV